jgi:DNA/RNA-binding domain of Phe-tRNA-synthetase-like protein
LTFTPTINPSVAAIAPGSRAISIVARRTSTAYCHALVASRALDDAIQCIKAGHPAWATAHLEAWREVFRRFGSKPQRTPCSAEALRERVLKSGSLPPINPVVDLYNAISLKYAIPVGGENLAAYQGVPRLVLATGTEMFDTMKNGEVATESPEAGEVVWRDDIGVTCRRWNWRQGVRTRLTSSQLDMWFILESLPEMPFAEVEAAAQELKTGLQEMFGDVDVAQKAIAATS